MASTNPNLSISKDNAATLYSSLFALLCRGDYEAVCAAASSLIEDGSSYCWYLSGIIARHLRQASKQEILARLQQANVAAPQRKNSEPEFQALVQLEIGILFWEHGDYQEAQDYYAKALNLIGEISNPELLMRIKFNQAVSWRCQGKLAYALEYLDKMEDLPNWQTHPYLRARWHLERAINLKDFYISSEQNLKNWSRAIIEYTAASICLEEAGQTQFIGFTDNGLALLYLNLKQYDDAHHYAARAKSRFAALQRNDWLGQACESSARIYLAEDNPSAAYAEAKYAVALHEPELSSTNLVEALTTKGVAAARLNSPLEARNLLERAALIALAAGNTALAGKAHLALCEELRPVYSATAAETLTPAALDTWYFAAAQELAATLTPELEHRLRLAVERLHRSAPEHDAAAHAVPLLPRFIAAEDTMQAVVKNARRWALSAQTPVCLTGGSGTGKTLLARWMHRWSGRPGQLVIKSARSLTDETLEAAVGAARGGTFVIRRLEHLSGAAQDYLLAYLATPGKTFLLTTADALALRAAVNCNRFDEGLYYRLTTRELRLPPFAERPASTAAILELWLAECNRQYGQAVGFERDGLEFLARLHVPDGGHALRALLERTVSAANEVPVTLTRFDCRLWWAKPAPEKMSLLDGWQDFSLKVALHEYEAEFIVRALAASGGKLTRAAELLGLKHQTLSFMLTARHANLRSARKFAIPRKRSYIKR